MLCAVHGGFVIPLHFNFSSVHCPLIDNPFSPEAGPFLLLPVSFDHDDDNCSPAARHSRSRVFVSRCPVSGSWDGTFFSSSEIIQNIGLCRPCFCRSHPFSSVCAATSAFHSSLAQHSTTQHRARQTSIVCRLPCFSQLCTRFSLRRSVNLFSLPLLQILLFGQPGDRQRVLAPSPSASEHKHLVDEVNGTSLSTARDSIPIALCSARIADTIHSLFSWTFPFFSVIAFVRRVTIVVLNTALIHPNYHDYTAEHRAHHRQATLIFTSF